MDWIPNNLIRDGETALIDRRLLILQYPQQIEALALILATLSMQPHVSYPFQDGTDDTGSPIKESPQSPLTGVGGSLDGSEDTDKRSPDTANVPLVDNNSLVGVPHINNGSGLLITDN